MEKSQEQSSNKKEEKDESNNNEIIDDDLQNENSEEIKSKKDFSSKKTISNLSNSEKSNENLNKKAKSNDNIIDNKQRYKEVMDCIKEFEDKLENKGDIELEMPKYINQENLEERNKDIKNLKDQLLNVKNDENNLIDFINKIEGLLLSRQYQFNDKIFEKTVTELFYRKYNLTKFNAFKFINFVKTKEDIDFTSQIDYFKIKIEDSNGEKEYIFFKDRDYYPISYKPYFFLFEKNSQGILNKISIFSHNYKYLSQYIIERFGQNYIFPIYNDQLSEKFVELETEKNILKSKLQNQKDNKLSDKSEQDNLKNQINEKQIEQNKIINLEEKSEKINKKKGTIIFDKKEYLALITIENIQRELDGFYKTEEKITIKNKYSSIDIPENSYIIVEVKNHKKYDDIRNNIKNKKTLLNKLGIDIIASNFYFIGIINDFITDKYSQEIDNLKKEKIFIITENDVKIEEEKNIYVNYSKVDKDIKDIKNYIKNIQSSIQTIENTLASLIESIKPIIEDYKERKKINNNN